MNINLIKIQKLARCSYADVIKTSGHNSFSF